MSGKPRACGCKGYRTCLVCEQEYNLSPFQEDSFSLEGLTQKVRLRCNADYDVIDVGSMVLLIGILTAIDFSGYTILCVLPCL